MTPANPTANPTRIGRFEILRPLGKGAQGVVYLARDPQLGRQVAIKTVTSTARGQGVDRLMHEAQVVARLQHPNIVPIFEVGEHQGGVYLVFEYVEGTSLAALLERGVALPIHQAIKLITPILDGMAYAHEQGVVHGDLKPANILIGRNRAPRIMDFGIARVLGQRDDQREGVWGSLPYLSPEHVSGTETGPRSDIFALGLIFWEMLTGRRAIQAHGAMAIMNQIANLDVPPPSRHNNNVNPKLDAFVRKALERDPELRYADAMVMKHDLEAYLKPEEAPERQVDQSTLNFLIRRMRHKPDFPAISAHITEVNKVAASNSDYSANELANVVLKEYSLTNKLLKLVNSALYAQYGGKISTVSRGVVILGFDQVRMAALSLMLFEHLQNKGQVAELKDVLLGSLMSGMLAKSMAVRRGVKEPEQAFICALLHDLGKMLTIYYFDDEYRDIVQLMDQKGLGEEEASRSVLGLSYDELAKGIAQEWNFPPQILHSLDRLPGGEVDAPRTEQERLRCLANFSNELTRLAATTEPGDKEEALAVLTARFEKSLGVTTGQIDALMEQSMESLGKYTEILAIDAAKSPLIQRINRFQKPAEAEAEAPAAALSRPAAAAAASSPAEDHQMALLNGIQEITNALLGDYNVNDIMMMILETMYRGLGLTRVLVCISDPRRDTMAARFGFGPDIENLIQGFRFRISGGDDAFSHAVSQREDSVVGDSSELGERLPQWYRELIDAPAFALYPVIIGKVPVGLFYVDADSPGAFTPNHLNYLKTLRNQAVLAIKQKSG